MNRIDINIDSIQDIGQIIRSRRKYLGLTQKELGSILGKSNTYLSDIEVGKTMPSLKTIIILCNKLNLEFRILDRKY
ncbi:helix-turn-helix domain-containing protein [Proteiniclasticum ruminis]|uniref:Helix-turn-helix n=1 Tax=Proteiniclasticum ruminis TaxID=398199 RepID=A0A1I5BBE4_9CLOT|nr:helix-turn-helix transcriptional regulator [Proteiniclasticum ruminis]SFN72007.1 Helix-turn-helix [Proteiniclasticum ruminis]